MPENTEIQWADSTANPTLGCQTCELWTATKKVCYAGVQTTRYADTGPYPPNFETVVHHRGAMADAAAWDDLRGLRRLEKPWMDELPRLIFVSDMSDALSDGISVDYLYEEIIGNVTSEAGRRHHWLWLTKLPQRMAAFSKHLRTLGERWPKNLWAGTSLTTRSTTNRVKHLMKVGDGSTIRFLSVEPQWERIDLAEWLPDLDFVIQGGESGRRATPFEITWARELRDACGRHGVAYFMKQLGSRAVQDGRPLPRSEDYHRGDWNEWPKDLQVRKFPERAFSAVRGPRSSKRPK